MVFIDLQKLKIGCVNYAPFPKSGHNYCCILSIVSLTYYQTCEVTTIMYHDTFEWYISCIAILQGIIII